jgi:chromosome segregation ATPase
VNLKGTQWRAKWRNCRKQHAEEIREYKAKILDLENQVARLTMREAGYSSSAPIASSDSNFQPLQAKRDIALEEAKIAKSQALKVCMRNKVMRGKMEALQKEVADIQQQLQVVNEVVVDHKAKIGGLEDQNTRLKKFLLDAIVERKNMRTCTLFAMAKARQFEAEFEIIQKD